jgi:hypothetical protein
MSRGRQYPRHNTRHRGLQQRRARRADRYRQRQRDPVDVWEDEDDFDDGRDDEERR